MSRRLAMSLIDAIPRPGVESVDCVRLTYMTEDVKKVLKALPTFKAVTDWTKDFN